jgi:signal transduction histidine kinase/ActR/RegA family two-component response regulator
MLHVAGSDEYKWRHMIEAVEELGQGFTVFDQDLNLILCNSRFLDMLAFPHDLVHPGTVFADFMRYNALRGEYGPCDVEDLVAERVAKAARFEPHVFERDRPDGTVIEVRGSPLAGGGFITTYTDITDRKRAERMLVHAKEEAEAASRAKASFLATMSHEIRTPMNGVLGVLHLLSASRLDSDQRDLLETAQSSATALLAILNDILDFSKLEAGQLRVEAADFKLPKLVAGVAGLLRGAAEDKGLSLTVLVDPQVPADVVGDPVRLHQVLTNLAGNAIKFTAAGTVSVSVRVVESGDSMSCLRFEVADTGIGVAPEAAANLFQDFSQADGSISRRFGGTGLGLAICKRLVEMMGGEIGLDSQPGRGATFWFTMRVGLPSVAERKNLAMVEPSLDTRSLNILLAEDNPVNQKLTTILLTRWGHRVTLAKNGAEAVDAALGQSFDVVLMDVHMPAVDGFEATRRIREMGGAMARVPIIAMTADVLEGDADRCLGAGMDDYVAKPVDPPTLQAKLARYGVPVQPG